MHRDYLSRVKELSNASTNELLAGILIALEDTREAVSALQSEVSALRKEGIPVKNYRTLGDDTDNSLSVWVANKPLDVQDVHKKGW